MIDSCELVVAGVRLSVVVIATSVIDGAVIVVRRGSVAGEFSVIGLEYSSVVVGKVSVVTLAEDILVSGDIDVGGGRVLPSDGGFVVVCCVVAVMISEEVISGIGGEVVVCSAIEN